MAVVASFSMTLDGFVADPHGNSARCPTGTRTATSLSRCPGTG